MSQPTKKVETSEEKYMQQQLQLEREFYSIRQEYTVLDHDRERSRLHGVRKLEKGLKVFEIFRQECLNIRTDLDVAMTLEKKRQDAKMFDHLNNLLVEHDLYENAVESEKMYITEVEDQIKQVRKSVLALNSNVVSDRQFEERVVNAVRICALLENSLETHIQRFNLICTKNRKSREQIDHLLWDRRNFMNIWSKVIRKLSTGKKIMMDLIEQATIAYDQREDLCNKLQLLRLQGHKELLLHMDDMRELKRKTGNLNKLESFFNIKGRKRLMLDLEKKLKQNRTELQQKLEEKLSNQQQMLDDITEFCQETDQNALVNKYYNREEDNFMLFKYVSDVLAEMEMLGDQLTKLHKDIDDQKEQQIGRSFQQQDNLDILENRVNEAIKKTKMSEDGLNNLDSSLQGMMDGILNLFKLCRCHQDPLLKLLGDNATIKDYNVLLYLQVLEVTIHNILLRVGYKDRIQFEKKKSKSATIISNYKVKMEIYSIEKIVKSSPCALCMEHEMVSDVIDTLQVVWNKNFIKQKIEYGRRKSDIQAMVHNTSHCQLPKARQIMQKRYE